MTGREADGSDEILTVAPDDIAEGRFSNVEAGRDPDYTFNELTDLESAQQWLVDNARLPEDMVTELSQDERQLLSMAVVKAVLRQRYNYIDSKTHYFADQVRVAQLLATPDGLARVREVYPDKSDDWILHAVNDFGRRVLGATRFGQRRVFGAVVVEELRKLQQTIRGAQRIVDSSPASLPAEAPDTPGSMVTTAGPTTSGAVLRRPDTQPQTIARQRGRALAEMIVALTERMQYNFVRPVGGNCEDNPAAMNVADMDASQAELARLCINCRALGWCLALGVVRADQSGIYGARNQEQRKELERQITQDGAVTVREGARRVIGETDELDMSQLFTK